MTHLKPCPFCNGKAKLLDGCGEFWVLCECKASTALSGNRDTAIASWNTRAIDASSTPCMTEPISGNGRWEVRRKNSPKSTIGQFVIAHTAFEAWQLSKIRAPFNDVKCTLMETIT